MNERSLLTATIALTLALCSPGHVLAQDDAPPPTSKKIQYSPYPEKTFPNRVYFGDTHLHTCYSADAGMIGCSLGPEEAFVDIAATGESRTPDWDSVKEFSAECFVPLTVGGGVRSKEDIRNLLRAGADKVCLNTAAYESPDLIRESSDAFGSQCVVVSFNVRRMPDGRWECFSHCGTRSSGKEPGSWAEEVERLGAGEILLTSVERDGTDFPYLSL